MNGAGKGGTIASIGAIIGAVENALAPFGIKINEALITPARIVALIDEARARDAGGRMGKPTGPAFGRPDDRLRVPSTSLRDYWRGNEGGGHGAPERAFAHSYK